MLINRIGLTKDETQNDQVFLLSVPAGEDSLAHRRHVCSRVIPQSQFSLTNWLDPEKVFGRKAPLHVDLGCGDGSFLCALAQRLPDKNFLGIERLLSRIRSSARKAASLDNVRILQMESFYAVRYLLPAESVETFYLLFPDPWPKRRHHRRRIVTPDFLKSVHVALEYNGVIYIATDHLDYFRKIRKIAASTPGFAIDDVDLDLPQSRFWLIFEQKSATIYWLALRKVSDSEAYTKIAKFFEQLRE
ncbi:MAG: tRNA (guanosine(46)-N7)-methyltransferase TrmB [Verrucomicrobia bacterium]|nr:MAG: tRNA (guanosine(46)-N7)-methyltransferase TrmB [Verrucomicrobiota bacterium]PYK22971.1 MAG: tRNA (guanosine(46)-N7)-methyltransferase TrmB [Verrucomicrobiota bacterium]